MQYYTIIPNNKGSTIKRCIRAVCRKFPHLKTGLAAYKDADTGVAADYFRKTSCSSEGYITWYDDDPYIYCCTPTARIRIRFDWDNKEYAEEGGV